jgi:hypothetical protein
MSLGRLVKAEKGSANISAIVTRRMNISRCSPGPGSQNFHASDLIACGRLTRPWLVDTSVSHESGVKEIEMHL